jgi:hypothetical protein
MLYKDKRMLFLVVFLLATLEPCVCRPPDCEMGYTGSSCSSSFERYCEETLHKLNCSVGVSVRNTGYFVHKFSYSFHGIERQVYVI